MSKPVSMFGDVLKVSHDGPRGLSVIPPRDALVAGPESIDLLDALLLDAVERALEACPKGARGGLPRWRLRRVAHHVEANISGRLSNCELATVAQISTSHFNRTFRQTVGVSPHGYVIRRRVAAAQALIAEAKHPLAEVAIMCGTADQAHLNRLFAKHCGVSPGAWRRYARPASVDQLTANNSI